MADAEGGARDAVHIEEFPKGRKPNKIGNRIEQVLLQKGDQGVQLDRPRLVTPINQLLLEIHAAVMYCGKACW